MGFNRFTALIKNLKFAGNMPDIMLSGAKKTLNTACSKGRITFKEGEIPEIFSSVVQGLKSPSVTVGMNAGKKGQSVWGIVIEEAGTPVHKAVASIDTTRGSEPIIQLRRQTFNGNKKMHSFTTKIDANIPVTEETPILSSSSRTKESMTQQFTTGEGFFQNEGIFASDNEIIQFNNRSSIRVPVSINFNNAAGNMSKPENVVADLNNFINEVKKADTRMEVLLSRLETMNFSQLEDTTKKLKKVLEKQEKELAEYYAKLFTDSKTRKCVRNWRDDFIQQFIPTTNDLTGAKLPKATVESLKKKISEYNKTRLQMQQVYGRKLSMTNDKYMLADENYTKELIKRLNIKPGKSFSNDVMKQLKALYGLPKEEFFEEATKIMAKEMGLPASLMKIENGTSAGLDLSDFLAVFVPTNCKIYYNPELLLQESESEILSILRHELEHAKDFMHLSKTMDLELFKAITEVRGKSLDCPFDTKLWEQVKNAPLKIKNFNRDAFELDQLTYTTPHDRYSLIKYYNSLLEKRAYQAGYNFESALEGNKLQSTATSGLINSKLASKIDTSLKRMQKLQGPNFDMENYFNAVLGKAGRMVQDLSSPNCYFEQLDTTIKLIEQDIQNCKALAKQQEKIKATNSFFAKFKKAMKTMFRPDFGKDIKDLLKKTSINPDNFMLE